MFFKVYEIQEDDKFNLIDCFAMECPKSYKINKTN